MEQSIVQMAHLVHLRRALQRLFHVSTKSAASVKIVSYNTQTWKIRASEPFVVSNCRRYSPLRFLGSENPATKTYGGGLRAIMLTTPPFSNASQSGSWAYLVMKAVQIGTSCFGPRRGEASRRTTPELTSVKILRACCISPCRMTPPNSSNSLMLSSSTKAGGSGSRSSWCFIATNVE